MPSARARRSPSSTRSIARAGADPSVRVVIVRGCGPAFCAGGDVKQMAEDAAEGRTAAYAKELGLVNEVVPVAELPQSSGPTPHGSAHPGSRTDQASAECERGSDLRSTAR